MVVTLCVGIGGLLIGYLYGFWSGHNQGCLDILNIIYGKSEADR